jgi:hypothetical protein
MGLLLALQKRRKRHRRKLAVVVDELNGGLRHEALAVTLHVLARPGTEVAVDELANFFALGVLRHAIGRGAICPSQCHPERGDGGKRRQASKCNSSTKRRHGSLPAYPAG